MPTQRIAIAICLTVVLLGCKAKKEADQEGAGARKAAAPADAGPADARPVAGPGDPIEGARVEATPLGFPLLWIDHVVIVPAGGDVEATGRAILAEAKARALPVLPPGTEPSGERQLTISVSTPAEASLDAMMLAVAPRGVTDADVAAIAAATQVITVSVLGPREAAAQLNRDAAAIALAGARKARGWIFDSSTVETFAREEFAGARDGDPVRDVQDLIVIHIVRTGELLFLETRGLSRYGLPELYVEGVAQMLAEGVGLLLNATAQTLVERGAINRDGEFDVDVAALGSSSWQDVAASAAARGGTGKITWAVTWSKGDYADDPAPTLLELTPPGGSSPEALNRAIDAALGAADDPVVMVDKDPVILAARDRARAAFAKLAPVFAGGVPDGDHLMVKGSFTTDDGGIEWMWIEVTGWKGDLITGVLNNEPFAIADLHGGARVETNPAEIFDYLWRKRDGTTEGGETSRLIEERARGDE